jgi:glutaminyl-peptide cyclotransferase
VKDDNGNAINRINELEHAKGKIYANKFMTNDMLVLGLDGQLQQSYDLSALLEMEKAYNLNHEVHWNGYDVANNVLNGIAYHAVSDTFFVTGKNWHYIY